VGGGVHAGRNDQFQTSQVVIENLGPRNWPRSPVPQWFCSGTTDLKKTSNKLVVISRNGETPQPTGSTLSRPVRLHEHGAGGHMKYTAAWHRRTRPQASRSHRPARAKNKRERQARTPSPVASSSQSGKSSKVFTFPLVHDLTAPRSCVQVVYERFDDL